MTQKKKRDFYWIENDEKNKKLLEKLYPAASWEELHKAFPERNQQAIRKSANNFGFKRVKQNAWLSDEFDPIVEKYFQQSCQSRLKAKTRQELKMRLINELNKVAVKHNIKSKKWNIILKHGHELGLSWGAEESADETPENLWDEDILLAYLSEKRTAKELEKHFNEPLAEIEKKLPEKIGKKHELTSYRTSGGQSVYFYRERTLLRGKLYDRVWNWKYGNKENGSTDYGSMLVNFPTTLDWREIRIFALSEAYIGSEFHQEERFDSYLALGKHQYHYFMINGSLFSMPPKGKMDDKVDFLYDLQDEIKSRLRPITHKILWAHQGCTEERIERMVGFDPLEEVCHELGIPYFRRPVMSAIEWNNNIFNFYSIHGTTNAKKRGSMINAVCNLLDQFERMHFIIMSHQKSGMENVVPRLIRDRVNFMLVTKDQHLVITPSFRKYAGSIEERKGQALPARGSCAMILFSDGNCGFSD